VGFFCARVTFVTEAVETNEPRYTLEEARKLLHDQLCVYGNYTLFSVPGLPLASSYLKCLQCGSLWLMSRVEELPHPEQTYAVRSLRF